MKQFKDLSRKEWYNILSVLDSEYKKAEEEFSVEFKNKYYISKSNRCDYSHNWYFDIERNKIYYYDYDDGRLKETKCYDNLNYSGVELLINN